MRPRCQYRVGATVKAIIAASRAEHGAGGRAPGAKSLVDTACGAGVPIEGSAPTIDAIGV